MKKEIKKTKTKKIKKTKEKSGLRIIILILIFVLAGVGIYLFLNVPDSNNKLTLFEKQWIDKNKDTLMNIEIPNNLSIYGENGKGVLFDFIDNVENETNLTFNKISYNYPSNSSENSGLRISVLSNKDKIKKDDIIISEDKYVLVSDNNTLIDDFSNESIGKIGILNVDKEVFNSIYAGKNYSFESFVSLDKLFNALKKKDVKYIAVPRYYALSMIVSNKLYINYNFNNISNKIVLGMSTNDKLNSVVSKCLYNWKNNDFNSSYNKELMNFYVLNYGVSDVDKVSLSSKVFTYGYVDNSFYNMIKSKSLYGVAGEYINTISDMADIEINYVKYETNKELIDAISNGEVDISFINFSNSIQSGFNVYPNFLSNLVVLSSNYINLNSNEGLINRNLYLLKNNGLNSYVSNSFISNITEIDSVKKDIDDGLLILDEVDYLYYKNDELSDYSLVLRDNYNSNYCFNVSNNEKVLSDLLSFVSIYGDSDSIKTNGLNKMLLSIDSQDNFVTLYVAILMIILIPVILVLLSIVITKTITKFKIVRKEDILKYNDLLTSLKNRNYLNAHIEEWDDTKVYPRSIIMIDLNNLKYVNDNYSHEEGNNLIKKAAAILINTQLEKSEIIRTDGNEFLVYLIGYNESQIKTYLTKLVKEFEKLPYGFGAATGYSMIEDEIKTIDDAMNEAGIEMRKDKEQNYR